MSVSASPLLKLPSPAFHPAAYLSAWAVGAASIHVSSSRAGSYLESSRSSTPVSSPASTQVAARADAPPRAWLRAGISKPSSSRRLNGRPLTWKRYAAERKTVDQP
eukprot:scaffold3088_cov107-Isochrysis_galbana.AAC.2